MAYTTYNPTTNTREQLVGAIFSPSGGVTVQSGSIVLRHGSIDGEPSTISFYDGAIANLNIGAGLLLTTGDPTPPATNNDTGYGEDAGSGAVDETDAQLQATVHAAFSGAGDVEDVTYLQFNILNNDPNANGLRFEVVFASDEYPEFTNSSFVDVAAVYVNGTNYALFGGDALKPLSVVQANVDGGNFRVNEGGAIPIEYDGVSVKLQITAPLVQGTNTVKIAIADTGDSIYDSGLFVSGLQAVNYQGYGLSQQVSVPSSGTVTDSAANQTYVGDTGSNVVQFTSAGGGQDVFDGGAGLDEAIFQLGVSSISSYSWNGTSLVLNSGANSTTLVNVERVLLGDGTFAALDTGAAGTTFGIYAMLWAGLNANPDTNTLSGWVAQADAMNGDLGAVADLMIAAYAPGMSAQAVISYLYTNIVGVAPDSSTLSQLTGMIQGSTTLGDLVAMGALMSLNTNDIAHVMGSIQLLNHSYFG
jgi:hypothetical protein